MWYEKAAAQGDYLANKMLRFVTEQDYAAASESTLAQKLASFAAKHGCICGREQAPQDECSRHMLHQCLYKYQRIVTAVSYQLLAAVLIFGSALASNSM